MRQNFTIFAKLLLVICFFLYANLAVAQDNFKADKDSPNTDELNELSKKFKSYQTFRINPSDIKNALRKSKGVATKPQKIKLTIGSDIIDFNLFENDILSDDFVYFENGKINEKKPQEVVTYSGYIGNDPKNYLRILISDNRFSGFFKNEKGVFSISHLFDNGIKDSVNNGLSKRLVLSNTDDEISSLNNMICGNSLKPVVQLAQNSSNQRIAAFSASCKYIKLAIVTDYEYYYHENILNSQAGISGLKEKILDMVNKMEFILLNNNQSTYGIAPIGLRLQLSGLATYTNANDPFTYTGTDGLGVVNEFTQKINNGSIFTSNVIKNLSHLLTGRGLGALGVGDQFGQATLPIPNLCNNPAQATSVSTIKRLSTGIIIPYTEAWRTMLHEMAHQMGATSDLVLSGAPDFCNGSTKSIMCTGVGKLPYFNQKSVNEINVHLNSFGSCLNSNTANPAYSNNFTLKLNGNNIISTPIFVNSLTKTIDIPIDPTLPLTSSTFSSSNGLVTVTKINNNKATFKINSAPNFTLNVFAQNSCSYSQWGVPFVYSPSGARIAYNTYPNPADDIIYVDTENITVVDETTELAKIEKILLFSENGNFIQEIPKLDNKKIATQDIKNGLYFLHIIDKDGNVEKKRIIINHK